MHLIEPKRIISTICARDRCIGRIRPSINIITPWSNDSVRIKNLLQTPNILPIVRFCIDNLIHGLDPHPIGRAADPDKVIGEFAYTIVRILNLFVDPLVKCNTDHEFHG